MDRAHEKNGAHIIHSLDELHIEKILWTK
jgi:hypothetical protein